MLPGFGTGGRMRPRQRGRTAPLPLDLFEQLKGLLLPFFDFRDSILEGLLLLGDFGGEAFGLGFAELAFRRDGFGVRPGLLGFAQDHFGFGFFHADGTGK